jgi:LysR family nitrogen assimilation transcriptional regulator
MHQCDFRTSCHADAAWRDGTIAAMDLKQLGYFVHVAERGSFTQAASVLGVAQPALSRQVRALEVELRQTLLDRNGRGVTLTQAGQRLLAHARGILQQVERARQDLEDQRGAAAGLLSIGLPPSIGRTLTAPLVEAFRERFPKATLTMVEGLSTYTLEWLVQGRIDCAVVYNATPAAAIELQPVVDEALVLVSARAASATARRAARNGTSRGRDAADRTAPDRATAGPDARHGGPPDPALDPGPVTLAGVADLPLVIPSRPHAIRMRLEAAMAEAGLKPRIGLEIESVPAMLDLVQRHPLHAVLSRNALLGRADALLARPIVLPAARRGARPRPLTTTLWLATSAQRPRGPLLEQALALLAQLLRAQVHAAV